MSTLGIGQPVHVRRSTNESTQLKIPFVRSYGSTALQADDDLTYQPSTGTLSANKFNGTATTATTATNVSTIYTTASSTQGFFDTYYPTMGTDLASGSNVIRTTDRTKLEMNGANTLYHVACGPQTLELKSNYVAGVARGSSINSVDTAGGNAPDLSIQNAGGKTFINTSVQVNEHGDFRAQERCNLGEFFDGVKYGEVQIVSAAEHCSLAIIRSGAYIMQMGYLHANSNSFVIAASSGTGVKLSEGANSWSSASDERFKTIHEELSNVLETFDTIRCVKYNYLNDSQPITTTALGITSYPKQRIGFIAQDFQKHYPEAVQEEEDNTLNLSYQDIIPITLAGVKELYIELKTLKEEIVSLKARLTVLEP